MKVIDEKGRLFGKINVIDFLALLFFAFCISTFVFSYSIFKEKAKLPKEFIEVEMNCIFQKVNPEVLKMVSVGDKEIDITGKQIGEIVSIGEIEPYQNVFNLSLEEYLTVKDTVFQSLPAKIKFTMGVKGNNLYYKGKKVSINSLFIFKTAKYSVKTVILSPKIEKWVRVKVRFTGVAPELISIIDKGQVEKNNSGKVIARLSEIIGNKPSEISFLKLEDGKFVIVNDPYSNDLVALLDVLCNEKDSRLYFKNLPVGSGNIITFTSDLYSTSGTIINVEK